MDRPLRSVHGSNWTDGFEEMGSLKFCFFSFSPFHSFNIKYPGIHFLMNFNVKCDRTDDIEYIWRWLWQRIIRWHDAFGGKHSTFTNSLSDSDQMELHMRPVLLHLCSFIPKSHQSGNMSAYFNRKSHFHSFTMDSPDSFVTLYRPHPVTVTDFNTSVGKIGNKEVKKLSLHRKLIFFHLKLKNNGVM